MRRGARSSAPYAGSDTAPPAIHPQRPILLCLPGSIAVARTRCTLTHDARAERPRCSRGAGCGRGVRRRQPHYERRGPRWSRADSGGTARSSTGGGEPTTSLPTLGSISDQLARLPPVAPGDLAGVLDVADGPDVADDACAPDQIDLDTLERNATRMDVCAAPGAKFGIRAGRKAAGDHIDILDLDGRRVETVVVPSGWAFAGMTRRGVAWLQRRRSGPAPRVRRHHRAATVVPAGSDQRRPSVVRECRPQERGGRPRPAALTAPTRLARFPNIRELGDGLLAVDAELYPGTADGLRRTGRPG